MVNGKEVGVIEDDIGGFIRDAFRLGPIADAGISRKPFPVHLLQGPDVDIDVVIDLDLFLVLEQSVQSARVLL